MQDAVVLGITIFGIFGDDDNERHLVDRLAERHQRLATRPDPSWGRSECNSEAGSSTGPSTLDGARHPLLFPGTDKNLTRTPSTRRTACDARLQKASHEARFVLVVLGDLPSNLLNKNAFL